MVNQWWPGMTRDRQSQPQSARGGDEWPGTVKSGHGQLERVEADRNNKEWQKVANDGQVTL